MVSVVLKLNEGGFSDEENGQVCKPPANKQMFHPGSARNFRFIWNRRSSILPFIQILN